MKYQVSFSCLTCYFHIHIKNQYYYGYIRNRTFVQRCLWQQCLCQSNFDATSKWQTIYLTGNYLNVIGCWHAYCSTRKLLSEESYQALTVMLQGLDKGKGYSLIPNLWDWETHWKQSKKNWKNKSLTCEIFFQHSRKNFVSPHIHVICSVHCMACTFFFFGGGGEFL